MNQTNPPHNHQKSTAEDAPTPPAPAPAQSCRQRQLSLVQQPAAEGSLRSILLQHPSERLYLHPLGWTAQHLLFFCCKVIDQCYIHQPHSQNSLSQTTPLLQSALAYLRTLQRLIGIGSRNTESHHVFTCLGLEAQPGCRVRRGYVHILLAYFFFKIPANPLVRVLKLRYNQKPVCNLRLPLIARHNGKLQWAYVDST